jgi:hypothetical protein
MVDFTRGNITTRGRQRSGQTAIASLAEKHIMATEGAIQAGFGHLTTGLLRSMFSEVVNTANKEIGLNIQQFSKSLAISTTRNRDDRLTRIHKVAGQEAIDATVRAYVGRRKAARYPTRLRTDRYSGGKLEKALGSPEMALATWEGVSFINTAHLDRTAKQWYRLNFGAGDKGRNESLQHKQWKIKFYGEAIGSLTLQGNAPSAEFEMPSGFFAAPKTGSKMTRGEFIPVSQRKIIPEGYDIANHERAWTKGIAGQAFLDAGIRALAKSLGTGWSLLWREWLEEAGEHDTGPAALAEIPNKQIAASLKVTADTRKFTDKELRLYKSELARIKS